MRGNSNEDDNIHSNQDLPPNSYSENIPEEIPNDSIQIQQMDRNKSASNFQMDPDSGRQEEWPGSVQDKELFIDLERFNRSGQFLNIAQNFNQGVYQGSNGNQQYDQIGQNDEGY